jgi:hypothetical protein
MDWNAMKLCKVCGAGCPLFALPFLLSMAPFRQRRTMAAL